MSPDASSRGSMSCPEGTTASVGPLMVVLLYAAFASLWILLSDKAVGWLFTDAANITLASTLKGWAFVVVTSLLLYGMMRRLLGPSRAEPAPGVGLRPMLLPLALITLAIVALTGGGIARAVIHQKEKEVAKLQAIADLKTRQIADWLGERYGDARFVQTNHLWVELYRRWRDDGNHASRDLLRERLNDLRKGKSFKDSLLLDERDEPLWNSEGSLLDIDPILRTAARLAATNNQIVHIGPYRDSAGGLRLDFITPLMAADGRSTPIVVLRVDPADYLFPTLQTGLLPGASAEILLFRRDGDQVLFLNELRHLSDTAGKLRVPVSAEKLLAAQILRHEAREGMPVEGVDYRGVPVLGVVRAIHGTDWLLVAKLDKAELYAETIRDALWIALAGLLALFVAITSAFLFRHRQELTASLRERTIQAEKLRALKLLDAISEGSADAIFAKDSEGRYLLFNREAARVTGKTPREVLGRNDTAVFPPEQASLIMANDRQVMNDNRCVTFQEDLTTADGELTFLATKGPLHDGAGGVIGMFGISRDITERKRAEELLRHQEMVLREAAEIADVGGWDFDPVTLEGSWTEQTARIHDVDPGVKPDATMGMDFFIGESRGRIEAAVKEAIEFGKPYDLELALISAKGTHKWVRTICHPIIKEGRVVRVRGSIQDITERRRAEEALRDSLEEKVALLKEVHHRVKNNLQIVASLLNLQASHSPSPEVVEVLRDTGNRVRSMALLHEALYRSGNLARINFAAYVRELCDQLQRSYGPGSASVNVENHVAPIGLALEQAVPCGLIISELVSNALRHGFPEDRRGKVVVELQPDDAQRLILYVSDDGVGLPPDFDPADNSTLGLKLVSNLAGQLAGQLSVERPRDGGAAFRVVFPVFKDTPP